MSTTESTIFLVLLAIYVAAGCWGALIAARLLTGWLLSKLRQFSQRETRAMTEDHSKMLIDRIKGAPAISTSNPRDTPSKREYTEAQIKAATKGLYYCIKGDGHTAFEILSKSKQAFWRTAAVECLLRADQP